MYYLCLKIHFSTPITSLNYIVLKIRFVTDFDARFFGSQLSIYMYCNDSFIRCARKRATGLLMEVFPYNHWNMVFFSFYLDRHACTCFGHFLCLFKSAKCTVLRYGTYLLTMYTMYQLILSSYDTYGFVLVTRHCQQIATYSGVGKLFLQVS